MAIYYGAYKGYYADLQQRAVLTVTLSNGNLSWSIKTQLQNGQTGNVTRSSLYGVSVTIGGVQVKASSTVDWSAYQVDAVIASGTIPLSSVTISGGTVACSCSMGVASSGSAYVSTASGNLAVANPTVTLSISSSGTYSNKVVAGRSTITLTASASSGSGGTINGYRIYQDGNQISSASSVTITAPSAGSHTYYAVATDTNGTSGTSSTSSLTTVSYVAPTMTSVVSTRWSSGSSSGSASDTGAYARLVPTFTSAKIDGVNITTYCQVTLNGHNIAANTSGAAVYYPQGDLNTDTTYQVIYRVYDAFAGINSAVVVYDAISIGGRGIDLTYDPSTTKYGVGIGTKATAGLLRLGMPLDVGGNDISNLGSIQSANYKPSWQARQNTSGGVIAIKLNETYFNTSMFVIPITYICNYQVGEIYLSGYDYGANHWLTPRAVIVKRTDTFTWNFNFGYSGLHQLWIYINTPSQYCNFNIHDILNGHNGTGKNMPLDAIEISYAVPTGTLQTTVTAS